MLFLCASHLPKMITMAVFKHEHWGHVSIWIWIPLEEGFTNSHFISSFNTSQLHISSLRTTFKAFQQRCLLKVCEWHISFNEADTIQHTKCINSILFHVSPSSGLKGTSSLCADCTDLSRNK